MACISIAHMVHTDRPLTWRSKPSCPRCTLPFTSNKPDDPVHRVAYLLDCQHLLCGQCVQEHTQERCITCEICKHRIDIPDEHENVTHALHPSLFLLGVMQQMEYEMDNVDAYWHADDKGSPESDYTKRSTAERLSRSDVDNPKKLLPLLEKAYHMYEKSKNHLEKQAKIQQETVASVVEQINAHFIAIHNALQIEENRVLREARAAYMEQCQQNRKEQDQLRIVKSRLQDYMKQAKLYAEKKADSGSDGAPWKLFSKEVRKFLETEPMKLEGDGKKMLRPPMHYQPREAFLKDVQACHSLQIDAPHAAASLVPFTHKEEEKVHESAKTSSKHQEAYERKSRERTKDSSKRTEESKRRERSKESSSSTYSNDKKTLERSKERREERKTGERAKEPPKSHRSTEAEKGDHKRSDEAVLDGSRSVVKCEASSSECATTSQPTLTAWQRKLATLEASAKGVEKPRKHAASSSSVASTTLSEYQNASLNSTLNSEVRVGGDKWRTVIVTHIVSPREFYVQDEMFDKGGASSMSELCDVDAVEYESVLITGSAPITITPGKMYLVRAEGFGELAENNRWYRAEVQAVDVPDRGQYRVQYIDYGMYDTVGLEQIRPISAELAASAPMATRCALYELQPPKGSQQWTDECHQLMKDFIGGKAVELCELSAFGEGTLLVDLFLPPAYLPGKARGRHDLAKRWEGRYAPMSLRAALLYLHVADGAQEIYQQDGDARKNIMRKRIWQQERWLKNTTDRTLRHADIPRAPVLQEHDHFDCTITHAKSIGHFYIVPNEWKTTMLEPLQRHLQAVCQTPLRVYCPYVGLVCAFALHNKDGAVLWLRGRVQRVLRARCLLLAIDTGEVHEIPWTDLRLLASDDPAFYKHPLAVRCSLGHIAPRRTEPNGHWSKAAVDEFLQIVCSRALRFTVSIGQLVPVHVNTYTYNVLLYLVNKSDRDTCLNGLLVRHGHAACIGLEENVQDRIREQSPEELAAAQEPTEQTPPASGDVTMVRVGDPRMPVVMLRVVSPGEFYVLLCEQQSAFEQMHKLLQEHMDDRVDEEEEEEDAEEEQEDGEVEDDREGDESAKTKRGKRKAPGDVCVVFARVNEGAPCEWHRARIETVLDDGVHYEAFLIDWAVTAKVHRTNVARLTARMAQIQPVAFRCRLACVSPVGGNTNWHQSSLDAFHKLIASYAQHAISLDAKPKPNEPDQALPVVLWGVRVEDRDALAPSRSVYHNLNQALAKMGLAHLSERFRTFATSGSEAAEEHQLLEDAIEAQLRAELEQFFRTVAAVNTNQQPEEGRGGAGGAGGAVRDGSKTAENVLNEQEHELVDSQLREALIQVGSGGEGKPVHAWQPAGPLEKTIFVGVPTYVGSDGTVYLHDVAHEPVLERIRSVIQAHVASNREATNAPLDVGRACLARFHLDGQFYRATVTQKLDNDRYMVTFVDYGNVEECARADLLPAAVCGSVPVQAAEVRLSGIIPKAEKKDHENGKGKRHQQKQLTQKPHTGPCAWPEAALDACHALIVQKRCSVRVDPGERDPSWSTYGKPPAPYCTLQLLECVDGASVDVKDVLDELGLFERVGERRASVTVQQHLTPPAVREPAGDVLQRELAHELLQSSISSVLPPTLTPADRDLKMWIENIGTQFEAENAANSSKYEDPNEWNFDDSQDPLNHAQLIDALEPIESDVSESAPSTSRASDRGFRMVTVEIADLSPMPSPATLNSEEFETSSRLSEDWECSQDVEVGGCFADTEQLADGRIASPLFRSFPVLPQPERSSRGFYAEFTNYASGQTLYVYPHLEGHTRRMVMLAEQVQRRARSTNEFHRWQATLLEPGAPCLAPYKEDSLYYRAIVESRDEERREASVLFVDYLNRETVPLAALRKCPIEMQRTTLRNLPVRLAGVQTNPRLREYDVVRRLTELLEKPFFVKVVEQPDPTHRGVLPVELYTDPECHTLVYQEMINEKYFVHRRASEGM